MKTLILLSGLTIASSLKGQTTVYAVNSDGKIEKNNYDYFEKSTGKIFKCMQCSLTLKDIKPVNNAVIKIVDNKVYACGKRAHYDEKAKIFSLDSVETETEIGYLTSDKKIIHLKNGIESDKTTAPYIKDNKIYTSTNKLIKQIDGEEIYGAASYLLAL